MTKIVLRIEIDYDLNGEDPEVLENLLEFDAQRFYEEGMFSDDTDAEVVSYQVEAYTEENHA